VEAGRRVLRIAVVALAAWAGFVLLEPYGYGWVVLPVALLLTLLMAFGRVWLLRRGGMAPLREAAWADAVVDKARRPKAIAEVRAARAKVEGKSDARAEHARLGVLLAQLLDAQGDNAEGRALLDAIDTEVLALIDASLVRHGRAALALRAADPQGALDALRRRPKRTGEPELDLRLDLLEASARLELGEANEALETATRVRRAAGGDDELIVEARVLRAAALDAMGQRDDAVEVVRSLGEETIAMLLELGQPRVRSLAEAARASR
jgi:hypothetical protein